MTLFDYSEKFEIIMPDPLSQKLKGFLVEVVIQVTGSISSETGMILNLTLLMDCFRHLRTLRPQGFSMNHLLDVKDFFQREIQDFFKQKNIFSNLSSIQLHWCPSEGPHFSLCIPQSSDGKMNWQFQQPMLIEQKNNLGFYQSEHILRAHWKCESFFNSFDKCTLQSPEWRNLLQDVFDRQEELILKVLFENSQSQFGAELTQIDWTPPGAEMISFRK